MRIGVDAGGTFTDFVALHDDGRVETFKLRSNPKNPAKVILEGLRRVGSADVVHGSTVATNALLERKGVRTAFVTTKGFEDILEIGRQNRPELYNLTPSPRALLVPRELCFGVGERAHHDGAIALRPSAAELARLAARLKRSGAKAIAICFLHSYRNATNERAVAKALQREGIYVCASHEITPEFREYERASTTAVNAYVGPLMDAYLSELAEARGFRISIMQSNGGFLSARDAAKHAARTVLSGPAGGVIGAMRVAQASGFKRVLGFDMGGTSTDVSLIDGAPRETTEASIDGLPVRVPMLDIHTVGAGGGSIARIDAGGLLRVGPESAGADPGPACYGKGTLPTVTDAHVVLGHIASLLGGAMPIDAERAAKAIDSIAKPLKLTREAAAHGIIRVANANMERAIRVVSVERGYDPRDFALLAFGGCGGLHACDIARELGMKTVIVPRHAGVLSALGMLLADAVRDYSAGVLGRADLEAEFAKLERRALRESPGAVMERSADVRYVGQSFELNVAWPVGRRFHREHARTYGYARPDRETEVVTIRVRAKLKTPRVRLAGEQVTKPRQGPALLADYGSTTLIPAGWRYHRDRVGNIVIQAS
ncbi:MAG: hydantoinase/oxoprolinase family protein [Bryobacteraceae bacterium]